LEVWLALSVRGLGVLALPELRGFVEFLQCQLATAMLRDCLTGAVLERCPEPEQNR
jgi:hypothetical protein